MSNSYESLSPEQKQNFESRLAEMGLEASHVVHEIRTGDTDGPTIFSNHPNYESHIPPVILSIPSLKALRALGGIPDAAYERGEYDDHPEVPPEWPKEKSGHRVADLSPEENRNIRKAFVAQIYGNSDRVKSYEPVIDKNYFPMKVAAFAVENLVVDADHPLILKGTAHVYNFGVVTIKQGGQIQCETDAEMTVQKMIKEG